jgi:hypothetical protein
MQGQVYTETFTCAGAPAAVEIECGFVPKKVDIVDYTNGKLYVWVDTMADDTAVVLTDTEAAVASNGVTPSGDAEDDDFRGVTLGTGVQTASAVQHVVCYR